MSTSFEDTEYHPLHQNSPFCGSDLSAGQLPHLFLPLDQQICGLQEDISSSTWLGLAPCWKCRLCSSDSGIGIVHGSSSRLVQCFPCRWRNNFKALGCLHLLSIQPERDRAIRADRRSHDCCVMISIISGCHLFSEQCNKGREDRAIRASGLCFGESSQHGVHPAIHSHCLHYSQTASQSNANDAYQCRTLLPGCGAKA